MRLVAWDTIPNRYITAGAAAPRSAGAAAPPANDIILHETGDMQ